MSNYHPIIAIVQARMGSKRLPGKVAMKIYKDFSLLEVVLRRVKRVTKLNAVILMTSENKDCDSLVEIADNLGIFTIRGSEEDVLSRFVKAINIYEPRTVVRVCVDNPFVDPGEIDKLIEKYADSHFDYIFNASGFGAEIMNAALLLRIAGKELGLHDREHVTSYIIRHINEFRAEIYSLGPPILDKIDVDTIEDLERVRKICSELLDYDTPYWPMEEVLNHVKHI